MATPSVYRDREFNKYLGAITVSSIGDWAALLSLSVFMIHRTGQLSSAGLAIAALKLPALLAPILGPLGDRYGLRRTLVTTDATRFALFSILALFTLPIAGIYGLLFVAGIANEIFSAACGPVLGCLYTDDHQRVSKAQSASTQWQQYAAMAGMAVGSSLTVLIGIQGTLMVNAASFGVSMLLLQSMKRIPEPAARKRHGTWCQAMVELKQASRQGLANIVNEPTVRLSAGLVILGTLGARSAEFLVAAYAYEAFAHHHLVVLAVAAPAGNFVAVRVLTRLMDKRTIMSKLNLARGLQIAGQLVAGTCFVLPTTLITSAIGFTAAGTVFAGMIGFRSAVAVGLPKNNQSASFGWLEFGRSGTETMSLLGGGLVIGLLGARMGLGTLCLGTATFAGLWWLLVPTPHSLDRFDDPTSLGAALPALNGMSTDASEVVLPLTAFDPFPNSSSQVTQPMATSG